MIHSLRGGRVFGVHKVVADVYRAGPHDEGADGQATTAIAVDGPQHVEIAFDRARLGSGRHHTALDALAHMEHGIAN